MVLITGILGALFFFGLLFFHLFILQNFAHQEKKDMSIYNTVCTFPEYHETVQATGSPIERAYFLQQLKKDILVCVKQRICPKCGGQISYAHDDNVVYGDTLHYCLNCRIKFDEVFYN